MTAARLTWRFALLPALAVVALTVVMLACGHRLLADELTRRALASNQQRADLLGLQLQLSLRDAVTQVKLLARSPLMQAGAPAPRQRAELDHVVQGSPRFVWIGLAAPDGQVRAASRGWLEGQSIAQRPVFELGRQGMVGDMHEAVTLAPLLAQLRGGASELIDIGEPVRDEAGAVTGVLAAHLGLHWVREQLQLSLGRPEQAEAAGLRGLVLTGPRSVVAGAAVPRGLPADIGQARVWQGEDGRRWLLAQAVLQAGPGDTALLPWRVVVLQSEDAALAPLLALDSTMLAIGVVAALLLAAAGAWASRRLLTPWDPVFDAVLGGQPADADRIAARVQALVAARPQPTPAERLMGWLARDAGNLRRALDHLPVAVALADRHYRCEYVNPAYTRLLGWTTEAALGRPVGEALVDAAEREALARLHQQLGDAPGEFVSRLEARTPSGATVAVQCHLVPMFDAQGRLMGALCIVHDIRAERSARAQAHALHGRLQALADAAVDTLFATLDVDGRVLEWSRGAAALSGHASADALGRTPAALLGGGDWPAWLRCARVEGRCAVRDERFEGAVYALGLAPGPARFGLVLRAARAPDDGLAAFNRQLLDQERRSSRQLAQSLHDEVGQTLAALRLHWEAARDAGPGQRERMDERIGQLVTLANRQLRGVLAELRPPLLDELGLVAAIDNEIRQHRGAEPEVRLELQAGDVAQLQRWPADIEYAVFMIAREALLDALRHGPGQVRVQLDGDEQHLVLEVADDGGGPAPGRPSPVGLRERALAIGARLRVDARPGHGTMVALTCEAPDEDEPHLPDR
jgi:PAS domain S-box-containing protein